MDLPRVAINLGWTKMFKEPGSVSRTTIAATSCRGGSSLVQQLVFLGGDVAKIKSFVSVVVVYLSMLPRLRQLESA